MFKRKAFSDILSWSAASPHTALLVRGARQIGKSTLIRHLGETEYDVFVEVNLYRDSAAKDALASSRDAQELISRISLLSPTPLVPGKTLIFIEHTKKVLSVDNTFFTD